MDDISQTEELMELGDASEETKGSAFGVYDGGGGFMLM